MSLALSPSPTSFHNPLAAPHRQPAQRQRALTDRQAMNLQREFRQGTPVRVLAARYGIGHNTAHQIATGQRYAELFSQVNVDWVDPKVRRRGLPTKSEFEALLTMLKAHAGRWALVKQTRLPVDVAAFEKRGLEVSQRLLANGDYGTHVRWPSA